MQTKIYCAPVENNFMFCFLDVQGAIGSKYLIDTRGIRSDERMQEEYF